mmetsp:Transcript_16468/g.50916  ORF Transcript_16468/g.50916 Transcript_16468/m.50916 type:complete len:88 (+) Transcript_16468:346-609(+)
MLTERFGDEYLVSGRNDPDALARLSPTGAWRVGAFEITNLDDDDALLYSKLETKRHLVGTRIKVDGKVVHDDKPFDAWVAETLRPEG